MSAQAGADTYPEVGFTGGTLTPGASTGDIQLRFAKADWSPLNEADDHSYGTQTAYAEWPRATGYVGTVELATKPAEPFRSVDVCLSTTAAGG